MSTLTFTLCEKCGMHGRFVGTPNDIPVEVCSKCVAFALLDAAVGNGFLRGEELSGIMLRIMRSKMADVETAQDADGQDGSETWADGKLRVHVETWNEAAAATNDPGQFARSDFHAYVALLEAPPLPFGQRPQSNN